MDSVVFVVVVVAGTVVTRSTLLAEVGERSGSQGPMLVLRYSDRYRDGADAVLLESVRTVLLR